jgi:transposase
MSGLTAFYEICRHVNLTLVSLPAYSPELNPVEWIWLYLRERYLSHRLLADEEVVIEACCRAVIPQMPLDPALLLSLKLHLQRRFRRRGDYGTSAPPRSSRTLSSTRPARRRTCGLHA